MLEDAAGWIAPAATMIAAIMTAANLGTRLTGWGFVVFTVGSIAWVIVALATGQTNLLASNLFLTLVNAVGVWRWLARRARYDDGGESAAKRSTAGAAPSLFQLGKLEGLPITDPAGNAIGSVVDAMATRADGAVAYVVVKEGGVGGVGERLHALGWHEVTVQADRLATALTVDALRRRPVLPPDRWPATAEAAGVG